MGLLGNLGEEPVAALGTKPAAELSPSDTLSDAISLMKSRSVGAVVVTDHGRPVGIFTERDVLTKVIPQGLSMDTAVEKIMTPNPATLREDCSVGEVIKRMHSGGFRHMPLVDADDRFKELISVKQIVGYLVDHFPGAVFNLPPEPASSPKSREGA